MSFDHLCSSATYPQPISLPTYCPFIIINNTLNLIKADHMLRQSSRAIRCVSFQKLYSTSASPGILCNYRIKTITASKNRSRAPSQAGTQTHQFSLLLPLPVPLPRSSPLCGLYQILWASFLTTFFLYIRIYTQSFTFLHTAHFYLSQQCHPTAQNSVTTFIQMNFSNRAHFFYWVSLLSPHFTWTNIFDCAYIKIKYMCVWFSEP